MEATGLDVLEYRVMRSQGGPERLNLSTGKGSSCQILHWREEVVWRGQWESALGTSSKQRRPVCVGEERGALERVWTGEGTPEVLGT